MQNYYVFVRDTTVPRWTRPGLRWLSRRRLLPMRARVCEPEARVLLHPLEEPYCARVGPRGYPSWGVLAP